MKEKEPLQKITPISLLPFGFGSPSASISLEKKLELGRLRLDVVEDVAEIINSGRCVVPVQEIDDGCIDGRSTEAGYVYDDKFILEPLDKGNHERAKLAGGGYLSGVMMRIGAGLSGESIDRDIVAIGEDFNRIGVYCGAHTGSHANNQACDCGANDRLPEIISNGITFEREIREVTRQVLDVADVDFRESTFELVMKQWQTILSREAYFKGSTGVSRLNAILEVQAEAAEENQTPHQPAMTKLLKGNHNETDIVINYIPGTTVSQSNVHAELLKKYPHAPDEELPQAFVIDAWRIIDLAQAAVGDDDFEAALYSGVMYQIATAATLTDGSLRVTALTLP